MSGIFFVYCDTGAKVDDTNFNEWYDDIHIPDLFTLPAFLDGQRYVATDSRLPHYLSTFTLSTPDPSSIISSASFQSLVAAASPREQAILTNAQTINRRDMETLFEYPPPSTDSVPKSVAKYVFVALIDVLDDSPAFLDKFDKWYNEEHIPDISKSNGWVRSRRFKLKGSFELNPNTDSTVHQDAAKYVALHEFTNDQYMSDPAMLHSIQNEGTQEMAPKLKVDMRHFALHRNWYRGEGGELKVVT